jgi:hypothetical protein
MDTRVDVDLDMDVAWKASTPPGRGGMPGGDLDGGPGGKRGYSGPGGSGKGIPKGWHDLPPKGAGLRRTLERGRSFTGQENGRPGEGEKASQNLKRGTERGQSFFFPRTLLL